MSKKVKQPSPPTGITRLAYRAPIYLYRLGLGWLLGGRFLLLHHVGRQSGRQRQAVLEVANHDPATDTYLVASGFGKQSHWYKNVLAQPDVTIQVGRRRLAVTAVPLSPQASGEAMADYARRHPRAARTLLRLLGHEADGRAETYRRIGREAAPFVAFRPRQQAGG